MDKKFIRRQIVIKSTSFISIQTALAAYQPVYSLCQCFILLVMLKKSGWGKIGAIPHYGACTQSTRPTHLLYLKTRSRKPPVIISETLAWCIFLQYFQSHTAKTMATETGPPSVSHQLFPLLPSPLLSSPGTPMESRFPVRLDKRAVEEGSYMCRGVEAITPKGNGVEDEEEWSGGNR